MSKIKHAGISTFLFILVFSFGGKVIGFIREILIAYKFGIGEETDAYFAALTATGVVTTLLLTAISTTLVPILSEIEYKHGVNQKIYHANNMINFVFIITLVLTVVAWIFAPFIVRIIAIGFEGEQYDLAVSLTRIGTPKLLLTGLIGVLIAFLHSEQKFKIASSIHMFSSLSFVFYLLFFSERFGIHGLMVAAVISIFLQLLILVPSSLKLGFRYKSLLNIKDKYVHKFGYLILPVLLGTAINEVNVVIDKTLASSLESGSISALNYASILNNLVLGVFITAIVTMIFPKLSNEFNAGNIDYFKKVSRYGINFTLIISIPVSIVLILLAQPIVEIAFQRGEFDERATSMTSYALIFYSLGLVSMGLRLLITRIYYSLQDTKTPMINSAIAVICNIILNLILIRYMAHAGLALATSITATISTILLFFGLKKKVGTLDIKLILDCGIKSIVASIIMGVSVFFIYNGLISLFNYTSKLILLLLTGILGSLIYGILCYLLKIEEFKIVISLFINIVINRIKKRS